MSQSQLGLAILLSLLILLGLPAFLLPQAPSMTALSPTQSGSGQTIGSSSVPQTELNLRRTTQEQREEIRYARKININEADGKELQKIPRVGPNMAEEILAYRRDGNQFYSVSDLMEVSGFGDKTVDSIEEHIKVGKEYRDQARSGGSGGPTIDVNSASGDQLQTLSGIGSVTAQRIIEYREENDGIQSRRDLKAIPGIGSGTIETIMPQIQDLPGETVAPDETKININTAGPDELTELPGVGTVTAGRIVEYRNQHGDFRSVDELNDVSGIGEKTIEGLRKQATVR